MIKKIRTAWAIAFDAAMHFDRDDGWAMASHLALSALLAIFPFLIFATTLATFLGADQFSEAAVDIVFNTWPENIAAPLAREVENVLTVPRGGLLTISVLAAAFFASNGVGALRIALNRAYRTTETRHFILLRLQSFAFVLIATVGLLMISFLLIVLPLIVNFAEEIVHWLPAMSQVNIPNGVFRSLIALILLTTGLLVIHKWLPAGVRQLRFLMPGITFTIICWALGASLFANYLERFSNYAATYAGLASIMVALVFLYIIAIIFILGAELNASILQHANASEAKSNDAKDTSA